MYFWSIFENGSNYLKFLNKSPSYLIIIIMLGLNFEYTDHSQENIREYKLFVMRYAWSKYVIFWLESDI